jgi:hypothetical protein
MDHHPGKEKVMKTPHVEKDRLQDEITRVAYNLYEKSGKREGDELLNWLSAEKIVYFNHMILSQATGGAFALLEYKPMEKSQGSSPMRVSQKNPKAASYRPRKKATAHVGQGM